MRIVLFALLVVFLGCSGSDDKETPDVQPVDTADSRTATDTAATDTPAPDTIPVDTEKQDTAQPDTVVGPEWKKCPDEPLAAPGTLGEKAAEYDRVAVALHLHPKLKWVTSVVLPSVECEGGGICLEKPFEDHTWEDVINWESGANDGLWSGLYLASQAYRYAVTGEGLETIRVMMEGQRERFEIAGVPGIFVRQLIPPDVDGISCTENLESYIPDVEKDDDKMVRVGDDGCMMVVDPDTMEWVTTDHCTDPKFAGWCFRDNVSQDEYAGHMLALAAVWKFVDDEEIRAEAADMITKVGLHIMENDLNFVDWDGRITEHGYLYPMSLAGTPGFLAIEVLAWIGLAAKVSGDEDLQDYYDNCLLQRGGEQKCLPYPQPPTDFTDYLSLTALYVGEEGCLTNFNNISMLACAYQVFFLSEADPELLPTIQQFLADEIILWDSPKAAINHGNPWYSFLWAAYKPKPEEPALDTVEDAFCSLRQFPATQQTPDLDSEAMYPHYCTGRLDNSLTEDIIPLAHRCPRKILFWRNPYDRHKCAANPARVTHPGDSLLAYWMGRYHGIIDADD